MHNVVRSAKDSMMDAVRKAAARRVRIHRWRAPVIFVMAALVVSLATGCGGTGRPPNDRATRSVATETRPGAPRAQHARCGDSTGKSATLDRDRDPTTTLTRIELTLVDPRRSTPSTPQLTTQSCRVLPTEVRYPMGITGPLPLVVVAHGLDGDPSSLAPLLDAWAGAGYVVAAPTFPTTRKDSDGNSLPADSIDQARDMTFVIDQMLDQSRATTAGPLRGLIDPHHIGVAGMSLGGLSVYGLVSNTCCRDRRVGAAILMAAVRRQFPDDRYEDNRVPVLLVQGDADSGYHNSAEAYPELVAPKWFITLRGSAHSPPFEVPPGPEAPLVYAATTFFWDRYLKNDASATQRLTDTVGASHGRATLQHRLR